MHEGDKLYNKWCVKWTLFQTHALRFVELDNFHGVNTPLELRPSYPWLTRWFSEFLAV